MSEKVCFAALMGAPSKSIVKLLADNYDSINQRRDEAARAAGKRYYDAIKKQEA